MTNALRLQKSLQGKQNWPKGVFIRHFLQTIEGPYSKTDIQ